MQLSTEFVYNALILRFHVRSFSGLVRVCQTDTKEFTYLVHCLVRNVYRFEFHRDLSLVVCSLAYHLVETLLITT